MADFLLPKDGYLRFDSYSLRSFLVDKLNEGGILTDQKYIGSNVSVVIDIISYTYNALMYYLNKTSTESMFSESQIYENMNRIVKMIDYKPIGKQTSTLSFLATSTDLTEKLYTIPRYSFVNAGNIRYSCNEDITFSVASSGTEDLTDLYNHKLLYQGYFQEYPIYTASGQDNEVVFLTPGDNVIIDHFNIDIYVKDVSTLKWSKWEKTPSLYLETAIDKKYEIRYNESKRYEIKFGNNINGKGLNNGDQVAIYYLDSLGKGGEIGVNALQGKKFISYSTLQYNEVLNDVNAGNINYITSIDLQKITLDNDTISTYFTDEQSVDSIRAKAPASFRTQYRAVNIEDFESVISINFANIISDVKVIDNKTYLFNYLKYFYDLGITNPNNIASVLYNQIYFSNACNFNNIYAFIVPKAVFSTKNPTATLTPAQKEFIITSLDDIKVLTSEVVVVDPIYIAVDLCVLNNTSTPIIEDTDQTILHVVRDPSSRRDLTAIKNDVKNIFVNYFDRNNIKLGQTLDLTVLTNGILNVDGVISFYMGRKDNVNINSSGLSLLVWNPLYPVDMVLSTKNTTMSFFKYLYLYDIDKIVDKIVVDAESNVFETVEY